ncbi:hypothetical protein ACU3L3_07045 [Priestia endophytica]
MKNLLTHIIFKIKFNYYFKRYWNHKSILTKYNEEFLGEGMVWYHTTESKKWDKKMEALRQWREDKLQ